MKKALILISALLLTVAVNAQFSKGNGMFLKTGSSFVAAPTAPAGPVNLISNGTFGSSDYWEIAGSAAFTIGSGVVSYDDTGNSYLRQTDANMNGSMEANTAYTLTFDIVISSGGAKLRFGSYSTSVNYTVLLEFFDGSQTVNFTTPSNIDTGGLHILGDDSSNNSFTLDNLVLTKD